MYDCTLNWTRLPLENGNNFREIGGYPGDDEKIIRYHRFVRASSTSSLTGNDIAFLKGYGVVADIDLRSKAEIASSPDRLNGVEGIEYRVLPFSGNQPVDTDNLAYQRLTLSISKLYVREMIEQTDAVTCTGGMHPVPLPCRQRQNRRPGDAADVPGRCRQGRLHEQL